MKKIVSILLLTILLATQFVVFSSFAEAPEAKLVNLSGAVYPGCTLELGIAVTGENVLAMQFDKPILYDSEQLTMNKAPYTTISDWTLLAGAEDYVLDSPMTLEGKDANNLAMVRFSFTLNDSVKIGDTIKVEVGNVRIAADENSTTEKLVYSVTVAEKPKNTNCNLLSLRIEEGTLTPTFDAESSNSAYALTVAHDVESLTIFAGTANILASYVIEGNENLQVGENIVTITVTAESGATRTYTLTVTKDAPPSTETGLSTLEIAEGVLSPAFDASVTTYKVNVPSDVTSLTLTAVPLDPKASFVIEGNKDFLVGENIVTVKVTAEDPTATATYTITVVRARPIETDALLSDLSVAGQTLSPLFDMNSDVRTFSFSLPYEVEKLPAITATCRGLYASKVIKAPEKLEVGENTVEITVTAEDGVTVEKYTIIVTRDARILESDATLKELTPDSGTLSPAFDPKVTVYTMVTPIYHPSVSFRAVANNFAATTKDVTAKLVPGLNTVSVSCVAENGSEQVYTIHVFVPVREEQKGLLLNGAPLPGEKLMALLFGETKGGSYSWYVGDKLVEGATSDSFTPGEGDVNKTIKAVYTDVDGTVLTSQTLTVVSKNVIQNITNVEPQPVEKAMGTTELVIIIVLVFISIILGVAIGSFVVKRAYRSKY